MQLGTKAFLFGLALVTTVASQAAEPWRQHALRAADRLAERVEILDESVHEVYEKHSTPGFKKAIEDIHHIEKVLETLRKGLPAAPFNRLCDDMHHLYEDLVQIRLDLINLGIQNHPTVVRTWNAMVEVYNRELNPYFRNCPRTDDSDEQCLAEIEAL